MRVIETRNPNHVNTRISSVRSKFRSLHRRIPGHVLNSSAINNFTASLHSQRCKKRPEADFRSGELILVSRPDLIWKDASYGSKRVFLCVLFLFLFFWLCCSFEATVGFLKRSPQMVRWRFGDRCSKIEGRCACGYRCGLREDTDRTRGLRLRVGLEERYVQHLRRALHVVEKTGADVQTEPA